MLGFPEVKVMEDALASGNLLEELLAIDDS